MFSLIWFLYLKEAPKGQWLLQMHCNKNNRKSWQYTLKLKKYYILVRNCSVVQDQGEDLKTHRKEMFNTRNHFTDNLCQNIIFVLQNVHKLIIMISSGARIQVIKEHILCALFYTMLMTHKLRSHKTWDPRIIWFLLRWDTDALETV